MTSKEWKKYKLGEIAEFNPSESIKKGQLAKKIAMEKLIPYCKQIPSFERCKYNGGTKFRNGDTIMARITPCLENGKISKVTILNDNEIGFGSTEYIVFRAIENLSNPDFLYYLITSSLVREPAIKSMVGSSGRQRVQIDVVKNIEIGIPPLETQQKIASILSSIDDKIELNNSINNNLEQQAQAIFLELFKNKIDNVEFNNNKQLKELVQNVDNRGKTPPCTTVKTLYPIIDVRALSGNTRIIDYNKCTKYVEKDTYDNWFRNGHPQKYDILLSTVGSLAEMKLFMGQIGCIAQNVVGYRCNISPLYLYQYLNFIKKDLLAYDIGSVQPSIKVTHIAKHPIYIPSKNELEKFHSISEAITNKIYNNCKENEYLTQLRDTLLPKLMSGEIDVSEVDISTDKLLFS